MKLLNELEQQSKTIELELFLEDLREMGADPSNRVTSELVYEEIERLVEVRDGDYGAYAGLAQQAGIDPRAAKPGVMGALEPKNPRIGLERKSPNGRPSPQRGQKVVFRSKFGKAKYEIVDNLGDMVVLRDPRDERYSIRNGHLKAAADKEGNVVGWSARQQPAPYQSESLMQQISHKET